VTHNLLCLRLRRVEQRLPQNETGFEKGKDFFQGVSEGIYKTATVQKLSQQVQSYICAYYVLHQQKLNNCEDNTTTLTLPLSERLMKEFKTQGAAVDFDAGFVQSFILPAIEDVVLLAAKNEVPTAGGGH
jgi:hypothetical protein